MEVTEKTIEYYESAETETLAEYVALFGHDISDATPEQLRQVELAIENAWIDIDGCESSEPTEYGKADPAGCLASYIGGCIENNYNLC